MPYPERKPIYDTYKEIIKKIIDSKMHKEYADSEIDVLDREIMESFKSIRNQMMMNKTWNLKPR